jgi:hypothetical protein
MRQVQTISSKEEDDIVPGCSMTLSVTESKVCMNPSMPLSRLPHRESEDEELDEREIWNSRQW